MLSASDLLSHTYIYTMLILHMYTIIYTTSIWSFDSKSTNSFKITAHQFPTEDINNSIKLTTVDFIDEVLTWMKLCSYSAHTDADF